MKYRLWRYKIYKWLLVIATVVLIFFVLYKIGFLGYLKNAVQQFHTWESARKLSDDKVWSNAREIFLLIGSLVVIGTYITNAVNRRKDINQKKFDLTIEAEKFFMDKLLPQMLETKTSYLEKLDKLYSQNGDSFKKGLKEREAELIAKLAEEDKKPLSFDDLFFSIAVEQSKFGFVFNKLNFLSAYIQYRKINKYQFFSTIADEVTLFTKIDFFLLVKQNIDSSYLMKDYNIILKKVKKYAKDVTKYG